MQFKDNQLEYRCTIVCIYKVWIKKNSGTSHIQCYLADWGYLKDSDRYNLSNEISLFKLSNLEELVAI